MKHHPGEKNRQGGVEGVDGDYFEATDASGRDEPFGEGVHLFAESIGKLVSVKASSCLSVEIGACAEFAVEDNGLDNHCHVGEVEVAVGAFPQAD